MNCISLVCLLLTIMLSNFFVSNFQHFLLEVINMNSWDNQILDFGLLFVSLYVDNCFDFLYIVCFYYRQS